jgi:hypothetical protein
MSFDASEHRWAEIPYCPNCREDKAPHFMPRRCAEPGCKVHGCSACLVTCDIGAHTGSFCEAHIGVAETGVGSQWHWVGNACGPCRVQLAEDLAVIAKEREKECRT